MPDYSKMDTAALLAEAERYERAGRDATGAEYHACCVLIPALVQRVRELEADKERLVTTIKDAIAVIKDDCWKAGDTGSYYTLERLEESLDDAARKGEISK